MRQAGRHLPEYRALKERYTFHELVQTPELATEVTLQPIRRYNMDAAILFSDILVIPEALGQPYHFRSTGGIEMEYAIRSVEEIRKLDSSGISEKLSYVGDAIRSIRRELGEDKALIGFGGAPWTLATYMVEGGSSKDYRFAKELYLTAPDAFEELMQAITAATIEYFQMQVDAGVDVLQIFDSWGGVLGPEMFWDVSGRWIKDVVEAMNNQVPVIGFSKGAHDKLDELIRTKPQILGVSWTTSLASVRRALPDHIGVQGNLDPVLMNTTPDIAVRATEKLLHSMEEFQGFIFNLGHGISPHAKPETMQAMVETVRSYTR